MRIANQVLGGTARAIAPTACAARCRRKAGEGEISPVPSRAILAHPGKQFLPTRTASRPMQALAGA